MYYMPKNNHHKYKLYRTYVRLDVHIYVSNTESEKLESQSTEVLEMRNKNSSHYDIDMYGL